jgi:hypothetical protein
LIRSWQASPWRALNSPAKESVDSESHERR